MNSTDIMKLRMLLHVVDVHCTLELKLKNQFNVFVCTYVVNLFMYCCLFVTYVQQPLWQ